jgi:hypothetical protein
MTRRSTDSIDRRSVDRASIARSIAGSSIAQSTRFFALSSRGST